MDSLKILKQIIVNNNINMPIGPLTRKEKAKIIQKASIVTSEGLVNFLSA